MTGTGCQHSSHDAEHKGEAEGRFAAVKLARRGVPNPRSLVDVGLMYLCGIESKGRDLSRATWMCVCV